MAAPQRILLSGIPGSGKTEFAKWLRDRGWIIVINDHFLTNGERNTVQPGTELEAAWLAFTEQNDPQHLQTLIAAAASPILIEWGFPEVWLERAVGLSHLGLEAWWFDGDIDTCHSAWMQVHSATEEYDWKRQICGLRQAQKKIAAAYGPRVVRVIEPGPLRLSHEEIAKRMGLDTLDR